MQHPRTALRGATRSRAHAAPSDRRQPVLGVPALQAGERRARIGEHTDASHGRSAGTRSFGRGLPIRRQFSTGARNFGFSCPCMVGSCHLFCSVLFCLFTAQPVPPTLGLSVPLHRPAAPACGSIYEWVGCHLSVSSHGRWSIALPSSSAQPHASACRLPQRTRRTTGVATATALRFV